MSDSALPRTRAFTLPGLPAMAVQLDLARALMPPLCLLAFCFLGQPLCSRRPE